MAENPDNKPVDKPAEPGSKPNEELPANNPASADSGGSPDPKSGMSLEEAKKIKKDIDDSTTALKKENDRREKLAVDAEMDGKGYAGFGKKKTEDEKWVEGAKERYAGTGLDPTPDDTPTKYS